MKRPIAIGLSPNADFSDGITAFGLLFSPKSYRSGKSVKRLEQWFREFFSVDYAISCTSARGGLMALLQGLSLEKGDEVLLQAFTCVALPDAILAAGLKPVFVDIHENLLLNLGDLEKKITKQSKVLIVQHTFGIPQEMEKIEKFAKKYQLAVIEDCAHGIGDTYKGRKVGTFGDAAFFSFGRDKAFSSVFGGMVITKRKELAETVSTIISKEGMPSAIWTMQQLFHPIAFGIILPLYNFFSVGKALIVLLQKAHLLSFPVSQKEKEGVIDPVCLKALPNGLAFLALSQLEKLESFNKKRREFSKQYKKNLDAKKYALVTDFEGSLLRFPVYVKNRDILVAGFRKKGIYLGAWYSNVIDPKGTDLKAIGYHVGLCPVAESIAQKILNLPVYPHLSKNSVEKVISALNAYA